MMMHEKKRKVTVVGAGAVGSTFAFALAQSGLADEIALVDFFADLAKGQAMDLAQGGAFFPQVDIHAGDERDYADSDIVAITAGAKQKPGESRIDLLKRNAGILRDIALKVAASGCRGVMLVVSGSWLSAPLAERAVIAMECGVLLDRFRSVQKV